MLLPNLPRTGDATLDPLPSEHSDFAGPTEEQIAVSGTRLLFALGARSLTAG